VDCDTHGANHCTDCDGGFYLTGPAKSRKCEKKQCKCNNGTEAIGRNCEENGRTHCVNCDDGFRLDGRACREKQCTCKYGMGAKGQDCKTDGSEACRACHNGLELNGQRCERSCVSPASNRADAGYPDAYRGWYDVQGCGRCNDYCRWVGNAGSGGDPRSRMYKVSVTYTYSYTYSWFLWVRKTHTHRHEHRKDSWWSCRSAGGKHGPYTGRNHFSTWRWSKCHGEGAAAPKGPDRHGQNCGPGCDWKGKSGSAKGGICDWCGEHNGEVQACCRTGYNDPVCNHAIGVHSRHHSCVTLSWG